MVAYSVRMQILKMRSNTILPKWFHVCGFLFLKFFFVLNTKAISKHNIQAQVHCRYPAPQRQLVVDLKFL